MLVKGILLNNGWTYKGTNHYGGRVYTTPDGGKAIETFNYYHKSDGFSVFIGGEFLGRVRTPRDLP
jgi:hypothetical protein